MWEKVTHDKQLRNSSGDIAGVSNHPKEALVFRKIKAEVKDQSL